METDLPILLKTSIPYPEKMPKAEIISQARRKIELEPLRLSQEPTMVANSGGFDILSEIKTLKARADQQDKRFKNQEEKYNKRFKDQEEKYNKRFKDQEQKYDKTLKDQEQKYNKTFKDQEQKYNKTLKDQEEKYNKRFKDQETEIAMLHQTRIRNAQNELIGRSSKRKQFSELRQERNKEEHGANVGFYRYVINAPGSEKDREDACAEGFEETYGITPEEYDSHFKEAPEKILQYVNHRGDVWHYWPYTKSKHHKTEVEKMKNTSDEIVKLWMSEGKTITEKIKEKMSEFDQLHELWKEGEEEKKRERRKRKGKGKAEDNHSASPGESDVQ